MSAEMNRNAVEITIGVGWIDCHVRLHQRARCTVFCTRSLSRIGALYWGWTARTGRATNSAWIGPVAFVSTRNANKLRWIINTVCQGIHRQYVPSWSLANKVLKKVYPRIVAYISRHYWQYLIWCTYSVSFSQ